MEKPYSGKLWVENNVGYYKHDLFTWDHKIEKESLSSGIPSFWHYQKDGLQVDKDQANCGNCGNFLGEVHVGEGCYPPTFIMYKINSELLQFDLKPDFENPHIRKNQKKRDKKDAQKNKKKNFMPEEQE